MNPKQHNAFLSVRLEGPNIKSGRMRLDDFLLLSREILRAADRVAMVLSGRADSRVKGRRPDEMRAALALDLVAFTHGSQAAVARFDRSEPQAVIEEIDFGLDVFASLLQGLSADWCQGDPLPSGYDVGVLMAVRDLGSLFEKGITHMDFCLAHRHNPLRVRYDIEKRTRLQSRIGRPDQQTRTVEGRLNMVDFNEGGCKIRIEPSVGTPIYCNFDAALRDAVYDNVLQFVRVTGVAEADSVTGKIKCIKLADVMRLEPPQADGKQAMNGPPSAGAFWESPTIDELSQMQEIKPARSLDDMLGGWPDDEIEDGFEQAVAHWRSGELERGR